MATSAENSKLSNKSENSKLSTKSENSSKSDQQNKKAGNKSSKGFKRSEHKSRISLMHFNRKVETSSDEEVDTAAICAHQIAGDREQRLQAVTFGQQQDEESASRLTFRDPLPPVQFASHHCVVVASESKNQKDENSKKRKQKMAQSQSDWI